MYEDNEFDDVESSSKTLSVTYNGRINVLKVRAGENVRYKMCERADDLFWSTLVFASFYFVIGDGAIILSAMILGFGACMVVTGVTILGFVRVLLPWAKTRFGLQRAWVAKINNRPVIDQQPKIRRIGPPAEWID